MRCLLDGGPLVAGYSVSMWIPKGAAPIIGRYLFEARSLLEEMQYFKLDQNHFEKIHQNKLLPKGTFK